MTPDRDQLQPTLDAPMELSTIIIPTTARPSTRHRRGFTLVEATMAVLIVGVMLVAAMTVAGQSARTRGIQKDMARGQALAGQLLSEIVQQAYQQPGATTTILGPEAGETRATFNDVDDFNGWTESPPADITGTPVPGFTGWKRSVLVEWIAPAPSSPGFVTSSVETGMKRITVIVTSPSGEVCTAVALRSPHGQYDKPQGVQSAYRSWVGTSMQIGTDANTTAAGGVNPLNQVP